jgi:hypothetical protein
LESKPFTKDLNRKWNGLQKATPDAGFGVPDAGISIRRMHVLAMCEKIYYESMIITTMTKKASVLSDIHRWR